MGVWGYAQTTIPDNAFDLVTSFSVIEHLDTDLTDHSYVPYPQQRERCAQALNEMIRVTKVGGYIYVTSECCDYKRATTDAWRGNYYFEGGGPDLSSAWPVRDVQELFYDYLTEHGCSLVGPKSFSASDLNGNSNVETFRGPFFSGFAVLATKNKRETFYERNHK
jgi:ubiquinone/menaquinone biosynthesis C-methylase UbiE